MLKHLPAVKAALCAAVCAACLGRVNALDYSVAAPASPEYGKDTSVELVSVAGGGTRENTDLSKSAAVIPPKFGSPSSYLPGSGEYLTPDLVHVPASALFLSVDSSAAMEGDVSILPDSVPGASMEIDRTLPSPVIVPIPDSPAVKSIDTSLFTEVTSDLYYSGGYLGTLRISSLGVTVRVYEGTDSTQLAKGAGHFPDTSIWDGNCCIAAHNRGSNSYFGKIHTLNLGDRITLTTKLGTRSYQVTSVSKVSETDTSGLTASSENMITLYTCVQNQSGYRWCVKAVEAS